VVSASRENIFGTRAGAQSKDDNQEKEYNTCRLQKNAPNSVWDELTNKAQKYCNLNTKLRKETLLSKKLISVECQQGF